VRIARAFVVPVTFLIIMSISQLSFLDARAFAQTTAAVSNVAVGRREPADDKLLFLMHFHLEPLPGAAFFVKTIAVLGYYSFKPFALGDAVRRKAVRRQAARKEQLLWWFSDGGF
jgi:hypothetical protein